MADRAHYYETIPGWFDYADIYAAWVAHLSPGAHIVEVGGFMGRSASFMGVEIANSGKAIRYDVVDTWQGSPEHAAYADELSGSLYDVFLANTATVREYVRPVRATSVEAAALYADESVDAVFLDGDHATDAVVADCQAWWPKIKRGGTLAGHDRDWASVARGAKTCGQLFGVKVQPTSQRSWVMHKPLAVTDWAVPEEERALLVAVCSNERNVYRQTVKSLWKNFFGARVTNALTAHGWQDIEPAYVDQYPSVAAQRDYAMMAAQTMGASHVLFLDADMTWTSDAMLLDRILPHHSIGIVSGVYHLKTWPYWPVVLDTPFINPEKYTIDYHYVREQVEGTALFRADVIGMGCALVPVRAVQHIPRPWFEYMPDATGLPAITEDVAFCARARAIDCPIWVDPTITCGHIGQQEITLPWFQRAQVEMQLVNAKRAEEAPDEPLDDVERASRKARAALATEEARLVAQSKRQASRGSAA